MDVLIFNPKCKPAPLTLQHVGFLELNTFNGGHAFYKALNIPEVTVSNS